MLNPGPTRGMMKFVKENLKGQLKGAEVGIAEGYHAWKYLKFIKNIKTVYLIDPYQIYKMEGKTIDYTGSKKEALKRLRPFEGRIFWYRVTSLQASKKFEDEELDFVYIDANHSYKSVLEDITAWYPKVKKGGVIGGHDFSGKFPGVTKAVVEYAEKNKIEIMGSGADWWYCK